jgi:5'-3' exonuclease
VNKTLLIDGDEFIFRASAAVETVIRWDDQNHVLYANENKAWDTLIGMLDRIFDRFDTKEHALCFSAAPNFRYTVDPTYKNNRAETRKPLCYSVLLDRVQSVYNCISMPGLEADDVMGILATKPGGKNQRIIVSQDKDMRTIPTTVWNGKDMFFVDEAEANRRHLYQTLCGDTSDGYPGCPGAGDVSVTAFLENPCIWTSFEHTLKAGKRKGEKEIRWSQEPLGEASIWDAVVSWFVKAGKTADDALTQARLARILRWSDWDGATKQPILWSPT